MHLTQIFKSLGGRDLPEDHREVETWIFLGEINIVAEGREHRKPSRE